MCFSTLFSVFFRHIFAQPSAPANPSAGCKMFAVPPFFGARTNSGVFSPNLGFSHKSTVHRIPDRHNLSVLICKINLPHILHVEIAPFVPKYRIPFYLVCKHKGIAGGTVHFVNRCSSRLTVFFVKDQGWVWFFYPLKHPSQKIAHRPNCAQFSKKHPRNQKFKTIFDIRTLLEENKRTPNKVRKYGFRNRRRRGQRRGGGGVRMGGSLETLRFNYQRVPDLDHATRIQWSGLVWQHGAPEPSFRLPISFHARTSGTPFAARSWMRTGHPQFRPNIKILTPFHLIDIWPVMWIFF